MKDKITGGSNIAIKIPRYKYDDTVHFYKDIVKLPYLGLISESHAFQFGEITLWLDCMDNYSQQDVWLELKADDVTRAATYFETHDVNRRDEVEIYEESDGYWISDPAGTILRVNNDKEE